MGVCVYSSHSPNPTIKPHQLETGRAAHNQSIFRVDIVVVDDNRGESKSDGGFTQLLIHSKCVENGID